MQDTSAALMSTGPKGKTTKMFKSFVSEELVQRAIRGDKDALAELLETTAKRVIYYTTNILRSRMDAEDAAQEVLIRVCTKIETLKTPKTFEAWLKSIIANETRRYMMKNYIRNELDIEENTNIEETDERALPQASLDKTMRSEMLVKSVNGLAARQKEAVYNVHYLDMSVKETAKVMGTSKQGVYFNLKMAYKNIENDLRSQGMVSAYGLGVFPLGVNIGRILIEDSDIFGLRNAGWIKQTVEQCGVYMNNAAAAGTVTGANVGAAAGHAGIMSSIAAPVIGVAATAAAVTGIALGVTYFAKNEAPPVDPPAEVQYGPVATNGGVIFTGGTGGGHINPTDATVWLTNELEILSWRIMEVDSRVVLFSGEGASIDGVLGEMQERGMDGRYIIMFSMEDETGGFYTVDREFTITSPPQ